MPLHATALTDCIPGGKPSYRSYNPSFATDMLIMRSERVQSFNAAFLTKPHITPVVDHRLRPASQNAMHRGNAA